MPSLSRLLQLMTRSQRSIALTSLITLVAVALVKFVLVRSLLGMGVPREVLQAQDAVITGVLAGTLVWFFLIAERVRRKQEEEQIRVVADLHHHLRNALEIIFASEYLRESDKAAAILESIERIDAALRMVLPQAPATRISRWRLPTRSRPEVEERRKATRKYSGQQVTVRRIGNGPLELTGTAKDVSAHGMFLYLDGDLVVGTEVELSLAAPAEVGRGPAPVRGRVVRLERSPLSRSGVGIAFAPA